MRIFKAEPTPSGHVALTCSGARCATFEPGEHAAKDAELCAAALNAHWSQRVHVQALVEQLNTRLDSLDHAETEHAQAERFAVAQGDHAAAANHAVARRAALEAMGLTLDELIACRLELAGGRD